MVHVIAPTTTAAQTTATDDKAATNYYRSNLPAPLQLAISPAPTQAGEARQLYRRNSYRVSLMLITMDLFWSSLFWLLDFAPPISALPVFASYDIVAGSSPLDSNGNVSASYYGSPEMLHILQQ
jgi:hypothetical protein